MNQSFTDGFEKRSGFIDGAGRLFGAGKKMRREFVKKISDKVSKTFKGTKDDFYSGFNAKARKSSKAKELNERINARVSKTPTQNMSGKEYNQMRAKAGVGSNATEVRPKTNNRQQLNTIKQDVAKDNYKRDSRNSRMAKNLANQKAQQESSGKMMNIAKPAAAIAVAGGGSYALANHFAQRRE